MKEQFKANELDRKNYFQPDVHRCGDVEIRGLLQYPGKATARLGEDEPYYATNHGKWYVVQG